MQCTQEEKSRLAAAQEVALTLMKHGLELTCVSKWGVPSNIVLRLVHVNGEFHLCWRDAHRKLGLSLKYVLDVVFGVRLEMQSSQIMIDETSAFALCFRPSSTLQFVAADAGTAEQLVNCLVMLTREVKKNHSRLEVSELEEKMQWLAYQTVLKEEELLQFDIQLRRQDAAIIMLRMLDKKISSRMNTFFHTWINRTHDSNREKMLNDKKRWRLHAMANAEADLQAWYHAVFCAEVYRLRGPFWHREASLATYKKQSAADALETQLTPLEEAALANVLCTPETTYGDVAGQMYVAKAILTDDLFKLFQTLAAQGSNVTKHPRNGRPSKKPFRLSFVEGRIFLTWKGRYGNQGIALSEVDLIQNGLQTEILKRSGRATRSDVYLSLVCPMRSLDLCFDAVEEREAWQEMLERLILKEKGELGELSSQAEHVGQNSAIDMSLLLGHK